MRQKSDEKCDADVIVVGGGPSGSMCAYRLGQRKLKVLVLEARKMPRPKPCGGWVNVRAFQEFPELEKLRTSAPKTGAAAIETAFTGVAFHNATMSREAVYNARRTAGYLVNRPEFDQALLKMAGNLSSVRVRQRARVVAVEMGERCVQVTIAGGHQYRCNVLVGADGIDSDVARLCGMRESWNRERLIQCLTTDLAVDSRTIDRLHGKQRRLHVSIGFGGVLGYGWVFPKRHSISVGFGCQDAGSGDKLERLYKQWTEAVVAGGLAPASLGEARAVSGSVPAGGALDFEGHVGKRLVLIGDAGGFASAATGEGIYPGMLSAAVAAEHIELALKSAHPQDMLMEFKFAWRRRFAEYIQMPNANLGFLLPLIYDNAELCRRLGRCYLFGENL